MNEIRIFDPKKNKYVYAGFIDGDTFVREIKKEHFVFKYKGYALQKDVFDHLGGVKNVELRRGDLIYRSKLNDWEEHGITDDLGHGIQRFLSVDKMDKLDKKQEKLL